MGKLNGSWPALFLSVLAIAVFVVFRSEVAASQRSPVSSTESKQTSSDRSVDLAFEAVRGAETARVTPAPFVPPPIARAYATKVLLNIEIREHTKVLADGVTYTYWTFGEDAPGNFIRVREGDLVETTLSNHPDNSVAHNVDFHAATGPGGGGEASFVAPGHSVVFTWRAMRAGLYLYHCVAAPAGLHIANGMYGLLLVEPKNGLPKVDQEFFIIQGEFYTRGGYGERGKQEFAMDKALKEQPEYVVFNGHVGALLGKNSLHVKSGESVRLYLGNAGPSLVSSFHIVGEIFDHVYGEGGSEISQHNVQTTLIPVGGGSIVEFVAEVPGSYQMVDHSMFRAFNKGAMAALEVEGPSRGDLFSGTQSKAVYQPGTHLKDAIIPTTITTREALVEHGRVVYGNVCAACHQPDGKGLPNAFPPLANSDFLRGDLNRVVRVLIDGLSGPIVVNGQDFNGAMPKLPLTDEDIAGALSFVRTHFGNSESPVSTHDVRRARGEMLTSSAAAAGAQ